MVDSLDSLQAFMGLVQMGRLMWCGRWSIRWCSCRSLSQMCSLRQKKKGELVHQSLGEELWILERNSCFNASQNITLCDLLPMLPLDVAISAGSQPAGNIGCLLSLGTAFHMLGTLDDLDDFCCGSTGSLWDSMSSMSTEVSILAVQRAHVALPIFVASTFRPFELPNKNLRGFSPEL